jgi:hypothetical protein
MEDNNFKNYEAALIVLLVIISVYITIYSERITLPIEIKNLSSYNKTVGFGLANSNFKFQSV